jgi:hypothetical protein
MAATDDDHIIDFGEVHRRYPVFSSLGFALTQRWREYRQG